MRIIIQMEHYNALSDNASRCLLLYLCNCKKEHRQAVRPTPLTGGHAKDRYLRFER